MADDKKKDGDGKDEGKKKGMSPIVLVAVGAIVGGSGAVFAVPPKEVPVHVEEPVLAFVPVEHPDSLEFQFNPRTAAGKAYASAAFTFVYKVREDREQAAFEAIKANWSRARSHALLLFGSRTVADLNSEVGKLALTKDLIDDLDASLFPGHGDEKVAAVSEILWSKWILQ